MPSYPIPGSRYVGGYIGVGLQKQETQREWRLLHLAVVIIHPPAGSAPHFMALGHRPNMAQIGWYKETVNNNTYQMCVCANTHNSRHKDKLWSRVHSSINLYLWAQLYLNLTHPYNSSQINFSATCKLIRHHRNISLTWTACILSFSYCNSTDDWMSL